MLWALVALILVAAGGNAVLVFGGWTAFAWASPAEIALLGFVAWWLEVPLEAKRIIALAFLVSLALALVPVWQIAGGLALLAFFGLGRVWTDLHVAETWDYGRIPRSTALVAAVTPLAFVAWLAYARPDLREMLDMYLPPIPLALVWIGAVGFSVVNAVLEEAVWRGVLHRELRALAGARTAILVGAVSFGLQQVNGFPRPLLGIVLVTVWGALLGWLRERAGGLLAPLFAHVVADLAISWIVLVLIA